MSLFSLNKRSRSGILDVYSYILSDHHTAFHSGCTNLHSQYDVYLNAQTQQYQERKW